MDSDAYSQTTCVPDDDVAMQLVGLLGQQTDSPGDMALEHDRYIVEESRNVQPLDAICISESIT